MSSESLTIPDVPDTFELKIVTQIAPVENTALEGLYMAGNSYCTQCEAEGFRRISYFLDRPDVLSEYRVTIKADAVSYPYLLSNGNKIAEFDFSIKGIESNAIKPFEETVSGVKPSEISGYEIKHKKSL